MLSSSFNLDSFQKNHIAISPFSVFIFYQKNIIKQKSMLALSCYTFFIKHIKVIDMQLACMQGLT